MCFVVSGVLVVVCRAVVLLLMKVMCEMVDLQSLHVNVDDMTMMMVMAAVFVAETMAMQMVIVSCACDVYAIYHHTQHNTHASQHTSQHTHTHTTRTQHTQHTKHTHTHMVELRVGLEVWLELGVWV